MEAHTFALISLIAVPFLVIGLLVLSHYIVPKAIWHSLPGQTVTTLTFIGAIAAPMAIVAVDAQGEYFGDQAELVGTAFALPGGVTVNKQMDRTLRLGDCWRSAVNWRSDVKFPSAEAFDQWLAREPFKDSILKQVAGYFGEEPGRISIADGALDLRMRDPKYQLVDDRKAYSQNVRILEFYEPFVCTAIDKDADGRLSLRPCDPVALKEDTGNAGRVIVNPSAKDRTLEGRIYYAQGPSYCTNPVRRAVNDALGFPHPEAQPNTNMGGVLPGMSGY